MPGVFDIIADFGHIVLSKYNVGLIIVLMNNKM
jgi:hypothetical protein